MRIKSHRWGDREPIGRRLRFRVLERDGFACHYCGRRPPEVELVIDHVDPVVLGGASDEDNLVAACRDCNAGKAGIPLRGRSGLQPEPMELDGFPVAWARLEQDKHGFYWVIDRCPLCAKRHTHGGGALDGNPRRLLGHRNQHCTDQDPPCVGYVLREGVS